MTTVKAQSVQPLIDSQSFVFSAQTVQPLRSGARPISTGNYSLRVTRDSIICALPYFGNSNSANLDLTQNVLRFKTTKFEFSVSPRKKDSWKISIKPRDNPYVDQLVLIVGSDGFTTLNIDINGYDSISFNGALTAPAKP
jgi:Domain of unknown function (DUF4251)